MNISESNKGNGAIILMATLHSIFPILIILSYRSVTPLVSLAISSCIAAVFFFAVVVVKNNWQELQDRTIWKDLLYVILFIGVIYYSFYFFGLKYTTATNASLIGLTEAFFTFILFNVWKKEAISLEHITGAVLMIIGAAIVLLPKFDHVNRGDIFIIVAALAAPFGNYYQRRLIKKISGSTLMFLRTVISLPFIFTLIYLFSEKIAIQDISQSIWLLLFNGVVILGFTKLLWLFGIARISVTKAISLLSLSPLLTMLLAYLILKQPPTILQIIAFLPLLAGLVLLTTQTSYISKIFTRA